MVNTDISSCSLQPLLDTSFTLTPKHNPSRLHHILGPGLLDLQLKQARADRTLWINIALAKVSSVKLDSMSRRREEFKSEEQIQSLL
ncbi:hypothetical protein EPR50_G00040200 [Perca flavescens]|uniref:Uncharacterized protein n=1 Tax=Perca flavescens TaxID=8167 RepID=A0A484DI76_PERFV|nr:hypothetical protein EPR50_G00040200 [Perca flavescens]